MSPNWGVFGGFTNEQLFAELRRRGWQIGIEDKSVLHPKTVRIQSSPQGDRNTEPEEKWLSVWSHLNQHQPGDRSSTAQADLHLAIQKLYLLLEPPSVRERRASGGD